MDCKEVSAVIYLFFDNEMEEEMLAFFRDHVDGCGDCAKQVAYTRKMLVLVRERCVRCSCPDQLRQRILTAMPHRQSQGPFRYDH